MLNGKTIPCKTTTDTIYTRTMPHPVPEEHKVTQCLQHNKILKSNREQCLREGGRASPEPSKCWAPSSSAALSILQPGQAVSGTAQGSLFWPHKPASEHIAQSPWDTGVLPWQVAQAPVWAPPLLTPGPSWQFPSYLQLPPASTKEEPRYPLCCPTGLWHLPPPPWDTPDFAVPTYSLASFRVSIRTSPASNHFVTH